MGRIKTMAAAVVLTGWMVICAAPAVAAENAGGQTENSPSETDYRIGAGDVLEISAWKNEDLSRLVTVLPDGKFSFPLVGQVTAGGKNAAQLQKELAQRLKRFVPDPQLTLVVQQVNSMWIFVIGRVQQPGRFQVSGSINVMQALATAGGLNSFAKRDQVAVFRERQGKTTIFPFDYDEVANGQSLEQNIQLMRGDLVVVR